MLGDEVVGNRARENGRGVSELGSKARISENDGDREIRQKRCRLGGLVTPISSQQPADRALRPVAPRPATVTGEIHQSGEFKGNSSRAECRPTECTRQQRDCANLNKEPAKPNDVEHTPPPEIYPHMEICEDCEESSSRLRPNGYWLMAAGPTSLRTIGYWLLATG